jgi:signal transduction histidine kinase
VLALQAGLALEVLALRQAAAETSALLHEATSLTALGTLARALIHDLVQPITAIRGASEVLLDQEALSPAGSKLVSRINRAVRGAEERARRLRRFGRPTEALPRPIRVHEPLEDAIGLVEHELAVNDILVQREYEDNLPPVRAPADLLERVFVNLLANARDAMIGRRGTITVSTRRLDREGRASSLAVTIRDQGPGIPPGLREQLFRKRVTTKGNAGGLGIGLRISREIVEQLGGSIEATSEPGAGACVTVVPAVGSTWAARRPGQVVAPKRALEVGEPIEETLGR